MQMNDLLLLLCYFVSGAMIMLIAIGIWITAVMPGIEKWSKRFFIILFSELVMGIAALFVDVLVFEKPDLVLAERFSLFFEYLFISLLMPSLTVYQLHCCGEKWKTSVAYRAVLALWVLFFLLLAGAQFTNRFYYVTPENQYYRGSWHPLLMVPLVGITLLNLADLISKKSRLPRKNLCVFLVCHLSMMVAMLVNMFIYTPLLTDIGIILCAFSMFGLVLSDQVEQHLRQQREIAHQRASILVLQMRPHFICNTMTSIYYLCDQDPGKAKQVTLDFTTYLRKNFTAIASENPIPFSEELAHTRAYLAVEQLQYEDRLFVDYDTPHTRFRLPPLTLQPIVENAVKHGMDPDADPLRISIRTRETEGVSEILVEDNGPGYEPADSGEPHTALKNIQQRLEMMCGGTLTILPREGGGTAVKVTIP